MAHHQHPRDFNQTNLIVKAILICSVDVMSREKLQCSWLNPYNWLRLKRMYDGKQVRVLHNEECSNPYIPVIKAGVTQCSENQTLCSNRPGSNNFYVNVASFTGNKVRLIDKHIILGLYTVVWWMPSLKSTRPTPGFPKLLDYRHSYKLQHQIQPSCTCYIDNVYECKTTEKYCN